MIETTRIWNLINPKLKENELIKKLNELSIQFTQNRSELNLYTKDEKSVAAYSAFYLPTNMPKFSFLMEQLSEDRQEEISKCHFMDFGSGPGTFSLAYLDYFQKVDHLEVTLVDRSKCMLDQARIFIKEIFPERKISFNEKLPLEIIGKTVLFFGHSFNEMGYQKGIEIINQISPEFLILIEPGTKEVFSYINDLRIFMRDNGYTCLYPCPSLSGDCPMEKRDDDWCHGVIRMVHDQDLERLSQLIKKDRRNMPFIAHVYQKTRSKNDSCQARLVRFLNNTKFGFEFEVCMHKDHRLCIRKIQILKKDLSKEQIKRLECISIGSKISFEVIKEFDDFLRVVLT